MWEVIFSPCYALYLKNRNETKILRKLIYAAYEEGIVNNLMCQKWFAKILVRERECHHNLHNCKCDFPILRG